MGLVRRRFNSAGELADALAKSVAASLAAGIAARGAASLAVSGGATPRLFFSRLSHADIDWSKVMVTLVDERLVPESDPRSNAALVRRTLLENRAGSAHFVPLADAGAARAVSAMPQPFDAVILGMGNDGHTASFFPGGDTLAEALSTAGPLIELRAPGAPEPRITLTLAAILSTRALYLHIEGAEKAATLERALADGPAAAMPVRAVLRQKDVPLIIYSCP